MPTIYCKLPTFVAVCACEAPRALAGVVCGVPLTPSSVETRSQQLAQALLVLAHRSRETGPAGAGEGGIALVHAHSPVPARQRLTG